MRILILIFSGFVFQIQCIQAQLEKFKFQPEKIKSGEVYFYKKSNQDGSHLHWVATYIADESSMESLKWMEGNIGTTLVSAKMDWETFSVQEFEGGRITPEGQKVIGARLKQEGDKGKYEIQIGNINETVQLDLFPWHSYDFDFTSLNMTWRHLIDVKADFTFDIADIVLIDNQPRFRNKGTVDIEYEKEEVRNGVDCLRYRIDGPGLEHRGGTIWVSKQDQLFIEYLIDIPDERGYDDMKFQFDRIEQMTTSEWEGFKNMVASGR